MNLINKYRLLYILPALIFSGCEQATPEQESSENISFYVYARPQTKEIVEDTESLVRQSLPLYVIEDGTGTSFSETYPVRNPVNGVWRSDKVWESREYSFYAYVRSAQDQYNKGILAISNSGRSVTVTQPSVYSTDPKDYADYLLSYRVNVNGSTRPLVKLDMERITTGVELYMTKSPNMSSVKLKKAEFRNILRSAQYNIVYHATSTDPDINGLKNQWAVNTDQSERRTYTYTPTSLELATYNEAKGRFAPENKIMTFLTVQQSLKDIHNALLYLEYEVDENGSLKTYSVEFVLGMYDVKSWAIGHKVRYYVSVDTGVKLEGSIEPWKTIESIEGTFLPK